MPHQLSKLLASQSVVELLTLANNPDPDELAVDFERLSGEERERFEAWAMDSIFGGAVQCILTMGAVFNVYLMATSNRPEVFKALQEKLGVSKTKAYEAIKIYKRFGATFNQSGDLHNKFPVESLKLLAAQTAPEQAAEDALRMAAAGERITIKKAKELIDRYTVDAEVELPLAAPAVVVAKQANADAPSTPTELWSHNGVQVRVVILSDRTKSLANTFVQHDVSEAFQRFQQACAEAVSHTDTTDAA